MHLPDLGLGKGFLDSPWRAKAIKEADTLGTTKIKHLRVSTDIVNEEKHEAQRGRNSSKSQIQQQARVDSMHTSNSGGTRAAPLQHGQEIDALAGVALLVRVSPRPTHRKVMGSIPSQGTCPGYSFDPQLGSPPSESTGHGREAEPPPEAPSPVREWGRE